MSDNRSKGVNPKRLSEERDGLKHCLGCDEWFPATTEYFNRNRGRLSARCKKCHLQYYYADHEYSLALGRGRYYKNRQEMLERRRDRYANDPEYRADMLSRSRKWVEANRERIRENKRIYRLSHPRQKENPQQVSERDKKRWARIKDKVNAERRTPEHRAYNQLLRLLTPRVYRAAKLRRRARENSLPFSFTDEDMRRMLIYWHDCCAVCGRSLQDLFGEVKQHSDHWIPVSDPRPGNPGTVATNIVPLCNRCNSTKSNKDPRQWLIERFGGRKAKAIIARIEAYFDWLRQQG